MRPVKVKKLHYLSPIELRVIRKAQRIIYASLFLALSIIIYIFLTILGE
jgi:hypothetical protein